MTTSHFIDDDVTRYGSTCRWHVRFESDYGLTLFDSAGHPETGPEVADDVPSTVSNVWSAGDVDQFFDFSAGRDLSFGDENSSRNIVTAGWDAIFVSLFRVGKWLRRRFYICERTTGADNADAATDGQRLTRRRFVRRWRATRMVTSVLPPADGNRQDGEAGVADRRWCRLRRRTMIPVLPPTPSSTGSMTSQLSTTSLPLSLGRPSEPDVQFLHCSSLKTQV